MSRRRVVGCWLLALLTLVAAGVCLADGTRDLRLAARNGNVWEVRRLVASGVPVDAGDEWGTTALRLAVKAGEVEVIRFLLEKGADPSSRETFFGTSVLWAALQGGEPDYQVAKMLLDAGAEDRVTALAHALTKGDLALARTAAGSGPVTESEASQLKAHFGELESELKAILATTETRPDPPPPAYTAAQLKTFAGRFESQEGVSASVEVRNGILTLVLDGKQAALAAVGERIFSDRDRGVTVQYFGRAGTVEGLAIERAGEAPIRMRFAETEIAGVVPSEAGQRHDAPEPIAEPTVHWPGFRGANRSGIGDGADTPVDFDLASGRGVAWRTDLAGLGNSSPVVWGDRVYVTTAVAEGGSTPLKVGPSGAGDEVEENTEHRWLVLAYDKSDGDLLWQAEVGRGVPLTKRHFKATQANSTPVTDGEHIVVVFPTAGLACLGIDGKLHWKHELGGLNAGGFNDPGVEWGFAASPIIHRGKVVLQVDVHDGPYLAAWDLETGRPLWRTERPDVAPSWATPAIWPTPGGDELVVNASIIRGYDPGDGRELWSLGPTSVQVVASPVVGQEHAFVSSGYPPARPIYALNPGLRGDHTIEADADDDALAWHQARGGAYMPTPLLYRGLLYVVHHNARIVAHDAGTGLPVYRARFSAGGTMTSSPVVANGKIYQGTEQGALYVLAAGTEYRELAVHEIGAPLMATPAISEGLLLVRTPSELIAFGGKPGT